MKFLESPEILLEVDNFLGLPTLNFCMQEFSTGLGFIHTKMTKKHSITLLTFGDFILVRSMELMKTTTVKGTQWVQNPDTHHQETFILLPLARAGYGGIGQSENLGQSNFVTL